MAEQSRPKIAVIIPCYREAATIGAVVRGIPARVDTIIVVDDGCPERSGEVAQAVGDPRLVVIRHSQNRGVGGAMKSGYQRGLELDCEVMVKLDGDGQMDPTYLDRLLAPVLAGRAHYAKGNRFHDFRRLRQMPRLRLVGNSLLSFVVKIASGYWQILDPTNGYTAIHRRAFARIDLDRLAEGFFFEIDLLIRLNIGGCRVADVAIPAYYPPGAHSSLSISRVALGFPLRLVGGLLHRLFYRYFLHDFNMVSVYLLFGLPLFTGGVLLGGYQWWLSIATGVPRTAGTIMLLALPIILGFQMLLQAVGLDIAAGQENRWQEDTE